MKHAFRMFAFLFLCVQVLNIDPLLASEDLQEREKSKIYLFPSAEKIEKGVLESLGLKNFLEISKIHEKLGNQKKSYDEIKEALWKAFNEWVCNDTKNPNERDLLMTHVHKVYNSIFERFLALATPL